MIKLNLDYPNNTLDNMYTSAKKKVQDIVTSSYDDIDNIIPDDIIDIDFTSDNDKDNNKNRQDLFGKFISLFE